MFKCQILGTVTELGEKQNKITTKVRERVYSRQERDMESNQWIEVIEGYGTEIVQEINASDAGLALWNSWSDEDRLEFVKGM